MDLRVFLCFSLQFLLPWFFSFFIFVFYPPLFIFHPFCFLSLPWSFLLDSHPHLPVRSSAVRAGLLSHFTSLTWFPSSLNFVPPAILQFLLTSFLYTPHAWACTLCSSLPIHLPNCATSRWCSRNCVTLVSSLHFMLHLLFSAFIAWNHTLSAHWSCSVEMNEICTHYCGLCKIPICCLSLQMSVSK